ncbi:protoglobin domain-containing protein [Mangrovicoccus algicola]|uniref:STAS domain-containing protein n=1 Tax=Mangrovicoccus algicola TaxID=2771008 RepID=A0A8J6YY06_9RHOB|nr:protoglobin domain-containing protein [Mangrovicoccus algicola]MBE3639832.1 STAS domain-containing protein [Mangrovicoccus algicola]
MSDIIASSAPRADRLRPATDEQLRWFDITETDRSRAEALAATADELAEPIIEDFYRHLLSFEGARRHFRDDDQIARVKQGQLRYFRELVAAALDDEYVANRRRIGLIHERAGVTPTLYVGAYAYYLHSLGHMVMDRMQDDPARAVSLLLSLNKIAHFDMALALETYVDTREAAIEQREREMSELPTPVLQLRDGLLLIPVVGTLDSFRARNLTVRVLERIRDLRARAVVLDITGVAAVDSAVASHLIQTMTAARLMGATAVLTGLSAEVAQALVKIGVTSEALHTAGDLQHGIEIAERLMEG